MALARSGEDTRDSMKDSMVTGRMSPKKKEQGARVLKRAGLSASQAINLMYDRLLEEGDAGFLLPRENKAAAQSKWEEAARFVDSLPQKRESRFHTMSDAEIKMDRLKARKLA